VNLRLVSAAIVLVLSGIMLGADVYESVMLAPNLQGAPTSLEHARGFYHLTDPGVFFRVVSTATQLFLVVAFGRQLEVPGHAIASAAALALAILADVITFKFHYPRNAVLFLAPMTGQAAEWAVGNYVRIVLILTAVILVMTSMIRIARETAPEPQLY